MDLPNGVDTTYTYDDANRLTGIDHVLGVATLAFVDCTLRPPYLDWRQQKVAARSDTRRHRADSSPR